MIALIDGDLVAYRCAASAENESLDIAISRADKLMRDLIEQTNAEKYRCFLTGLTNFRKQIDPEYKANRTQPRPRHLETLREFLIVEWKAEVQEDIEADDALGIAQCASSEQTAIVSLDKDLLQIPGLHYQWGIGTEKWSKDAKWYNVSDIIGLRSFYASSLIGDKSDNICGVDGLGKVKSSRLLADLVTEQEMFDACRKAYQDDERFIRNLKLLWILREEGDIYCPIKRGLMLA